MGISIILNGKPVSHDGAVSIMELLKSRNIDPSHVVVEVNRSILDKDLFGTVSLHEGDVVEILRFVGGG